MADTGTRVTCTDQSTGESESTEIVDNHMVIVDGRAFVSSIVAYANGTQVVTIKKAATVEDARGHQTHITRHFASAALR